MTLKIYFFEYEKYQLKCYFLNWNIIFLSLQHRKIKLKIIKVMKTSENTSEPKLVNIDKVLKDRNIRLYKILPRFIINFLKKLIHQDDLNGTILKNKHLYGVDFSDAVLDDFKITYKIIGKENIPETGRFIFVSNHPIGSLDGLTILSALSRICTNVKTIANDLLMNLTNLNSLFIGVNKHGVSSKESVKLFDEAFASDDQITIFPAGLVSRRQSGKIRDLEWKKTFLTKAIRHKRDIIPMHISGELSNKFYRIANIRKFLRIKINLEMMFLPSETYKFTNKLLTIRIGKPIAYQSFDKSKSIKEWVKKVKAEVYLLEI